MEALQNLNELRMACQYRILRRMLRAGGVGSIIFGLFALARGGSLIETSRLGEGSTLIGLFLVAEGIWILAVPRPSGLIMEGITFLVVGLWNLFISALGDSGGLLILSLLQLYWAVRYFRRYSGFSALAGCAPPKGSVQWLEDNIKGLLKRQPAQSPDTVEFHCQGPWKARLFQNGAMFVTAGGRHVFVLGKGDIGLQEGPYDGRVAKVSLRLGTANVNGTISPQSLARLSAWTSATA